MLLDDFAPCGVARHEQRADGVFAGLRQREAELLRLAREERVRDLHEDARAVAGARIGADRAAMLEIAQDRQRVGDDLMRLAALDVGDEADAAGILFQRRIVQAFGRRARMCARRCGFNRFGRRGRRLRICNDLVAIEPGPAHVKPRTPERVWLPAAPSAFAAPSKATARASGEPNSEDAGSDVTVPVNDLPAAVRPQSESLRCKRHADFPAKWDSDTVLTCTLPNFCLSHKRLEVLQATNPHARIAAA